MPVGGATYRDLVAWQKAIDLVEAVHDTSRTWPSEERFGLTNQVRRAAVSIPSNIAEGQSRNTTTEFVRFLSIAHGSLGEVDTQLVIAHRLRYIDDSTAEAFQHRTTEVSRLIQGLIKRFRQPAEST